MNENEKPYDERSEQMLKDAVAMLGNTDMARVVVKSVYALGRCDGALALMDKRQAAAKDIA